MSKTHWTIERRFVESEMEVRTSHGRTYMAGYAAVFDARSGNLGGFYEEVASSAFTKTIREADVRALQNHDPNLVLGRTKNGSLKLSADDKGLYYEVEPADTSYARDLRILMERGDVDQSSFAFRMIDDDWRLENDDTPIRTLKEVALVDVSPVTYPAYEDATSGVIRELAMEGLAKRSACQVGELCSIDNVRAAILKTAAAKPSDDTTREERKAKMAQELERIKRLEAELTGSE